MLYELRQYTIKPGKQAEWIKIMEEEIIPLQVSKGMVITGSFAGEDESVYVWMRRFADEEERVRLYDAVYKSEEWTKNIGPRVGEYLEPGGVKVTRMSPTPKSVVQ